MIDWMEYLKQAVSEQASDVFFVAGGPVWEKLEGRIRTLGQQRLLPEDTKQVVTEIYAAAGREIEGFLARGDDDFSFAIPGVARFRVNAYRQRGSMAAVIRIVSFDIPDWQAIGIPESVMGLSELTEGMVLVTGTAGSGKSTTLACIIDRINHTRQCHIVTLEDPIEFLHRHDQSIVSQREIAIDTKDYLSALRACVRQAPDVILLGEMRDPETIHTAISAAETGHLVIATLHTRGAVNAIDRIIDAFPSGQQAQIRVQLASVLRTVVSQQLLPDTLGGQVPACELLQVTPAVRSMIRDNKNHQIDNAIASGSKEGMISMDQSIGSLLRAGKITRETALHYADHPDQLARTLSAR
ncbi:MAG: PilT/PilU family type 4a pilus ATPase [Oscillospiraceae bacterium]|nr:PilT/PilU family type 4a pilus ATPase [Oscillospiraceae bacterium]